MHLIAMSGPISDRLVTTVSPHDPSWWYGEDDYGDDEFMGRHRAGEKLDPNKPFNHPDLKGETRPAVIKATTDRVAAEERRQSDRVMRQTRSKSN